MISAPHASEPRLGNPGQPTIARGMGGEAVRRVQRAIHRTRECDALVDGVFGPATERAVRRVQARAGIAVDGVVGPETWAVLPDGAPMPMLLAGSTGEIVRRLQGILNDWAWGRNAARPGPTDGVFGPRTALAVRAFQAAHRMPADGGVGDRTWCATLEAVSATLESETGCEHLLEE